MKKKKLNYTVTFKILGKNVRSLEDQLTEALNNEDYTECARIQNKIQDQKIKDLLNE